LAHLSVKEYMLCCAVPQFRISEATSHSLISKTCLAYLAQFDGQGYWDQSHLQDHPLARYAAKHWTHHGLCGDVDSEVGHQQLALNLFRCDDVFRNWNEIRDSDELLPKFKAAEPICCASGVGLTEVVRVLLKDGADVNAEEDMYGNALQAASLGGHEAIVKILLQNSADIDAQGGWNDSALRAASSFGHEAIVKMLLEHGADANAHGSSALQAASSEGHEAIVKMLLEHGADVNAQGGHYGSALQAASARGHEAIVNILLFCGADVNAWGGEYGSALEAALSGGHDAIIETLIFHGADADAPTVYVASFE
jgi:hypothetical protein